MGLTEPDQTPEAVPAEAQPAPKSNRGGRRFIWLWLVLVAAAVFGLMVGVGVALRGRTIGSSATVGAVIRPTLIVSTAAVSPVPSPSPSAVVAVVVATAVADSPSSDYVVQGGDTLRSIAAQVYDDADQWPRIYDANRGTIGPDPDTLQAGTHLRIP